MVQKSVHTVKFQIVGPDCWYGLLHSVNFFFFLNLRFYTCCSLPSPYTAQLIGVFTFTSSGIANDAQEQETSYISISHPHFTDDRFVN